MNMKKYKVSIFQLCLPVLACFSVADNLYREEIARNHSVIDSGLRNGSVDVLPPPANLVDINCITPACVKDAYRWKGMIDQTIPPCTNLYQMVCSKFIKSSTKAFDTPSVQIEESIKYGQINSLKTGRSRVLAISKAMELYRLCLNRDVIKPLTLEPLLKFFADNRISMPLSGLHSSVWAPESYSKQFDTDMIRYTINGLNGFFQFDVSSDLLTYGGRKVILKVGVNPLLVAHRSVYLQRPLIARLQIKNIIALFPGIAKPKVERDAHNILAFDQEAIAIMQQYPETEKRINFNDLKAAIDRKRRAGQPFLNLTGWLEELIRYIRLPGIAPAFDASSLNQIILLDAERLEKYEQLFAKYLYNSPRVLAIKAIISAMLDLIKFLPLKYRKYLNSYSKEQANCPMRDCLGLMPFAESRLYLDNTGFRKSNFLSKMMEDIKAQLFKLVQNNKFMDPQTKSAAYRKIKNVKGIQGYEDWLLNDKALNHFYQNVIIHRNQPLRSYLTLKATEFQNHFKSLDPRIMPYSSSEKLYEPNAQVHQSNLIFFINAAYILPPFYHEGSSSALNFGAIGAVIGHELGHLVDNIGKNYDSQGLNRNWWSSIAEREYDKQIKCIIQQYSSYTIPTPTAVFSVNGVQTVNENMADIIGLKLAYQAFTEYRKRYPTAPILLPTLQYTPDQLFFLSYASMFCQRLDMQSLHSLYSSSVYPPDSIRFLGSIMGFKPFQDAFNCQNSVYNGRSCNIWQ